MAEVIRFNGASQEIVESHRKAWALLFDVPARKLTAENYALLFQICGPQWVEIYNQNKPKAAAD